MIRINQIKLPIHHNREQLEQKIKKQLHLKPDQKFTYSIAKKSIDARKKPELHYVYSVDVETTNEDQILKKVHDNNIMSTKPKKYQIPQNSQLSFSHAPVVVGAGPAGLFCAYALTLGGYKPLILERGKCVEERMQDVEAFWQTGVLDPASNVQFGEGGAGTFSDGKLNTLVKDPVGRNRFVLETFVLFGAPEHILYENKPHIGTDILADVIKRMRQFLIEHGATFRFEAQVTDLEITEGHVTGVTTNGTEQIAAECVVLAIGHSARDTFAMLLEKKLEMEAKSFAVGFRVEHPQKLMNEIQYGETYAQELPAAPYKVTANLPNKRGVYSFCMCPGGYVVNASSEPGRLAINGMSYQARDSKNANSALIVTVNPKDFPDETPLGGIAFQRELERKAWELGEGRIPVQLFGDFRKDQASTEFREVVPQMRGGFVLSNVRSILPKAIGDSIEEGVLAFGKKLHGFDREDALLSGIESRTSSPVRITRSKEGLSNIEGIYPCGEGAGYAGGITSAAMDGIKAAEFICEKFRNF